ncbi:hypothetical protein B7P43_G08100 [Cryptotermes secundus]|uniref:CUB domain-containing protein n=1 Tax=Cryptotermes secundus TaxID=105785 RepID=A0A2J7Q665_9NEOP|nr:hypothetical protein B7P43_G08100 [Cryptotermes secundus]
MLTTRHPLSAKVGDKRLSLAEPGHILKLDFRNTFDVEYSNNCTYDYLEVRDGGHGYDRLIGQFCGNIFPDIIGSTSRYLWLRFKSDDTIEGAGFTAVYESILPSNGESHVEMPACQIFLYGYQGWVNSSLINTSYLEKTNQLAKPIDCMWIINVTVGWKVEALRRADHPPKESYRMCKIQKNRSER